jgi:hypothetical protein
VDRIEALGNATVPQAAAEIMTVIKATDVFDATLLGYIPTTLLNATA